MAPTTGAPKPDLAEKSNRQGSPSIADSWTKYISYHVEDQNGAKGTNRRGYNSPVQENRTQYSNIRQPTGQQETIRPFGQSPGNEMIPLYCAIMGFVIFALAIYVVYKHWRQRHSTTSNKLFPNSSAGPLIPKIPLVSAQPLINSTTEQSQLKMKRNASPRYDTRLFQSLPQTVFVSVVSSLNVGWDLLAQPLGYAPAEISAFACASEEAGGPAHAMLTDWSARDSATVSQLARALHKVGRRDVVRVLKSAPPPQYTDTLCTEMGHV